jgi:hypothetical protein
MRARRLPEDGGLAKIKSGPHDFVLRRQLVEADAAFTMSSFWLIVLYPLVNQVEEWNTMPDFCDAHSDQASGNAPGSRSSGYFENLDLLSDAAERALLRRGGDAV